MRKTIIIIFKAIRRLSVRKMGILFRVLLSHPLFSILTFYATYKTMKVVRKKFSTTHHLSGEGNAYRHALWSAFIMVYCCKISSPRQSLKWCKKITNLHESLFPNSPLEKKMDIHNNNLGMSVFMEMLPGIHRQFFETSFIIEKLDQKLLHAQFISSIEDTFPNEFVYLEK